MTVEQLLNNCSSRELAEWEAEFLLRREESKRAECDARVTANLAARGKG